MKGSLLGPLLGSVSLPWDSFSWGSQESEGKSTSVGEVKARKLKCEWFHPGVKCPSEVPAGKEVVGIWLHILEGCQFVPFRNLS